MIVPIVISSPFYLEEIAIAIAKTMAESKKKICIIASSDFTHHGPNYEYEIFKKDVPENIKKLDFGAIEFILNKDYEGFLEYVGRKNATICGYLPIGVMLNVIAANTKKVELLKYYKSSELKPDKNSVSYASIIFKG
jgi:MEMO1 family protein